MSKKYPPKHARPPKVSRDYIKTVDRLISILSKLDNNRSVTTKSLAEDLGVTVRTIQRDIELLSGSYPIYSPVRGRHAFDQDFSLRKVDLNEEQASLLSFLNGLVSNMGDKFERSFQELVKRLTTQPANSPFYAKLPEGEVLPESPWMKVLQQGIDQNVKVRIEYARPNPEGRYEVKPKEYTVEPLKIALYDGFWYLLTQLADKKKVIKYSLGYIRKAELTGDAFVPMAGLEKLLEQSVNIWFDVERPERVLVRVLPPAAKYFKERRYLPLQKIVETAKDGSLVIETYPAHPDEIDHTIMQWIPNLVVIQPEALRKRIFAAVRRYLGSDGILFVD